MTDSPASSRSAPTTTRSGTPRHCSPHARLLDDALVQLRAAAVAAAEHRNRNDLAADLGTKPTVLFPRPARPSGEQPTHPRAPLAGRSHPRPRTVGR